VDIDTVRELAPAVGASWRAGDAWLAGGTSLFSEPQPELTRLLDLSTFEWPALVVDEDGLSIAATCTFAELVRWDAPPDWPAAELVGQCCRALLGSFKIWAMATVGGNICLALPAAPMISLTAALDGVCELWSPEGAVRHVPVSEFVTGAGQTLLGAGELLRGVRIGAAQWRCRTAFRQFSLSQYGRSAAVVIGRRDTAGATVVTVSASTARPVQLRFDTPPSAAEALASLEHAVPAYYDDVHGHPLWREAITRRLVGEVVAELADGADAVP
jgi:CO/xanthine dehydrogenase FAD-binding subunit